MCIVRLFDHIATTDLSVCHFVFSHAKAQAQQQK